MPKSKRTKQFAAVKRMISPADPRLAPVRQKQEAAAAAAAAPPRNVAPLPAAMFFSHNTALGPPYHILLDTNFINFAIKNKLEIVRAAMDCLLAKCVPVVTDCVIAELEKLGVKYRVALRVAKDPRFERLTCSHKGTYADDCIVNRVTEHRCYIVGTCDKGARALFASCTCRRRRSSSSSINSPPPPARARLTPAPLTPMPSPPLPPKLRAPARADLRRRLRKIPGVPCMYITQRKFTVERMPVRGAHSPRALGQCRFFGGARRTHLPTIRTLARRRPLARRARVGRAAGGNSGALMFLVLVIFTAW